MDIHEICCQIWECWRIREVPISQHSFLKLISEKYNGPQKLVLAESSCLLPAVLMVVEVRATTVTHVLAASSLVPP